MKAFTLRPLSLILSLALAAPMALPAQTAFASTAVASAVARREARVLGPKLKYDSVIDINDYKGMTYLAFMSEVVKPALDEKATEGYAVAGSKTVKAALSNVSDKVRKKALAAAGGEDELLALADALEGDVVTLYTLPGEILKYDRSMSSGRFNLSTFLGLVSGGGVAIQYAKGNYAYNVHYGTGEESKDNRTGRSFGEGPSRDADDASDKAYLTDLEEYISDTEDLTAFYSTLLKTLTNCDASGYPEISGFGQTLLTDFLAVYTAEQDRNLMDGDIHLHWDAALLEVTLLAAFHAGQKDIKLFFEDPNAGDPSEKLVFTSEVVNQAPGGEPRTRSRAASLMDYWQFSNSTNPEHKNRSGINITKRAFRTLGKEISEYMRDNHEDIVEALESQIGSPRNGNLFEQLSKFLINEKAPETLGAKGYFVAKSFTDFLSVVRSEARAITKKIDNKYNN